MPAGLRHLRIMESARRKDEHNLKYYLARQKKLKVDKPQTTIYIRIHR